VLARLSSRLTYANVVSTLCLFILLGGSAVAASLISGTSIKLHSIPGNRLKNHTITGKQVNLGKLGKVRNAANADNLGGSPASVYRLHCPAGLAQGGGLCFELTPRTAANWLTALQTCSGLNRRLPTVGELAVVFNNVGASQPFQWTSMLSGSDGTLLSDDASRQLQLGYSTNTVTEPYRCVSDATN
jgi:hypothetical protein